MTKIVELFGHDTAGTNPPEWSGIVKAQQCPYLGKTCIKVRKSNPRTAIGTCAVRYGRDVKPLVICPHRFLERNQVFTDCLHLLTLHEPGNQLHVVHEIPIPGGNVDHFLVSARNGGVIDFVGIEIQGLDTTGTVWPERQRFMKNCGLPARREGVRSSKPFGMNWKMTAKTILVQLHHKIDTFQGLHKHLVLVVQDHVLSYMRSEFSFEHLNRPRLGDPMHIHAYAFSSEGGPAALNLSERLSTDSKGIAKCLGLQVSPDMELAALVDVLQSRISTETLLTL